MVGTAIVYSPDFVRHITPPGHPESPMRVQVIADALKKSNLPLTWLSPRNAAIDELALAHSPHYIQQVMQEIESLPQEGLRMLTTGDVVICKESFQIATLAAGAGFVAVDAVMTGRAKNCFCVVRPPGHHATYDRGMGFCLFNNVACAVRYLQKTYKLERVLVVDWDLHHGNGTEDIFSRDKSVLYFSTHQQGIYPGTGNDGATNCPIAPGRGSKEAIFKAFETVLAAQVQSFQPQFVFISCGFDAHQDDPLGALLLTDQDFYTLTNMVHAYTKKWADGKIVSMLEGGYNLAALQACSLKHVKALVDTNESL